MADVATDIGTAIDTTVIMGGIAAAIGVVINIVLALMPFIIIGLIIYGVYRYWTSRPQYKIAKHAQDRVVQKLTSW